MSLLRLLTEQTENFRLSFQVPYNRIPYLLDKLTSQNPQLKTGEKDGVTYVWDGETNEVLLKYDFDSRTMFSDLPFNELLNLGKE